jgi:hypothetical protein
VAATEPGANVVTSLSQVNVNAELADDGFQPEVVIFKVSVVLSVFFMYFFGLRTRLD